MVEPGPLPGDESYTAQATLPTQATEVAQATQVADEADEALEVYVPPQQGNTMLTIAEKDHCLFDGTKLFKISWSKIMHHTRVRHVTSPGLVNIIRQVAMHGWTNTPAQICWRNVSLF